MKKILSVLLLGTVLGCFVSYTAAGAYVRPSTGTKSFFDPLRQAAANARYGGKAVKEVGSAMRYGRKAAEFTGNQTLDLFGVGGTKGAGRAAKTVAQAGGMTAEAAASKASQLAGAASETMAKSGTQAGKALAEATSLDGVKGLAQTLKGNEALAEQFGKEATKAMGQAEKAAEKAAKEAAKKAAKEGTKKGAEEVAQEGGEKGLWDTIKDFFSEQTVSQNYTQYAILIYQGIEAGDTGKATKKVKVKGADPMGGSQGSPNSTSGTQAQPDVPMTGSTVVDSVNALVTLIQLNPIDLSLLSTEVEQNNTQTISPLTMGSSGSQAGLEVTKQGVSNPTSSTYTAYEEREITNRRKLLLAEWAAAATQIGEGSNAISAAFYERANTFIQAASASSGSIGGVSTINDSDRFVLFELTRGSLLSAIQLGLQSAITLGELKVTPPATTTAQGAVSLPSNRTQ